jgi:hypothetical protein
MTAPVHVTNRPLDYIELVGRAALALTARKYKFDVVDGDRRRFHDRTARPPVDLKIIRGKDQQCP